MKQLIITIDVTNLSQDEIDTFVAEVIAKSDELETGDASTEIIDQ